MGLSTSRGVIVGFGGHGILICGVIAMSAATGMSNEPADSLQKADDRSLPRYRLTVGDVLVYEAATTLSGRDSNYGSRDTIWIVAANDDGSHRLVIHHELWMESTGKQDADAEDDETATPRRSPLDQTLAYVDLHPDGRFTRNSSFGYQFDPGTLFPRLPPDEEALDGEWESEPGRYGDTYLLRVASRPEGSTSSLWQLQAERRGPINVVYESTESLQIAFNAQRGLIERIERKTTQDYGIRSEGTGTQSLVSVETMDPHDLRTFREQSDRYFEGLAEFTRLNRNAGHDFSRAEELIDQAYTIMRDVRAGITLPEIAAHIDTLIENEKRYTEYSLERAQKFEAMMGRTSEDWTLEDLDGNAHSLTDYRGRVVLLDFWYRGCGWCIRAMPQVKQVAERFADKPVTVLGMNTDRELPNAVFVQEAMQLNYPSLQATGIPEKYEVTAFPTLVILDRQGRIRDVHVGYADDLFDQVSASVDRLLNEPEEKGSDERQ